MFTREQPNFLSLPWTAAIAISSLTACLAQPSDVQPPEKGPEAPVLQANNRPGPELDVNEREIVGLPDSQRGFVLRGDSLLVNTSTQVWFIPGPLATPVNLSTTLSGIMDVVSVSDSSYLLTDKNGFFVFEKGEISPTPLSNVWTSSPAQDLLATPRPNKEVDIWIGSDEGIELWRAGRLFKMNVGDMPSKQPILSFGAPYEGAPAIWVASESTVYAIVLQSDEVLVYPDLLPEALDNHPIEGMIVDGEGTLWLLVNGVLRSRGYDGQWYMHTQPSDVTSIIGSIHAQQMWIEASGEIWRHQGGVFRKVANLPSSTLLGMSESGYAVISNQTGIKRLEVGRDIPIEGLSDGALVAGLVQAIIRPPDSTKVEKIEALLDGSQIEVKPFPWRVEFDAENLTDGFHSLVVSVTYSDGSASGNARIGFFVGLASTPTWGLEISFISQNRCQLCHNATGGNARDLSSKERWVEEIDQIIAALRSGRMPLPPYPSLTEGMVDRLETWRDANFPD